jgi:hypothetical protein
MISVICSWCGESWVKHGEIEGNKPSHGICTVCVTDLMSILDRQRKEEDPLSIDIKSNN